MSHKSLSIGMLPIVRLKKASSIVLAFTVLRAGIKRRIFPNLTLLLGYCVRVYSLSMSWAWSCKASTWLESLRPLTSAKRKTSYMNSYFKKVTFNWLKNIIECRLHIGRNLSLGIKKWQLFDVVSYFHRGSRVMFNIFGLVRIKESRSITSMSIKRNRVGKHIILPLITYSHNSCFIFCSTEILWPNVISWRYKIACAFPFPVNHFGNLALSLLRVKLFSLDFNLP